jgi:hypothetical protein
VGAAPPPFYTPRAKRGVGGRLRKSTLYIDRFSTMQSYLVCLTIYEKQVVWNRALVLNFVPESDDLYFYYKTLLDLDVDKVDVKSYPIPDSFNQALINVNDGIPDDFPLHDLETARDDEERRTRYYNYIDQLCMMERNRSELNVFKHDGGKRKKTGASSVFTEDSDSLGASILRKESRTVSRCRDWVNDLLRSLNSEYDEKESMVEDGSIVIVPKVDDAIPMGWIFTPTMETIRIQRGSRIVLDPKIGVPWQSRLGTDLYPDMVVARRLTTESWAFQHPTADALIRATIEWYIATQDTKVIDGITPWIPAVEREISSLFNTFRRIKINERLMNDAIPRIQDKHGQIIKLLHQVESQLLDSVVEHPETIKACPADLFQRYMIFVFRGFNIEKEYYSGNENLAAQTQRWARNQLGFRPNTDPLLSAWNDLWHVITRGEPTPDRVNMFLRSLSTWDPMEAVHLTIDQKKKLVADWVKCYIDNELIIDPDGKELSTVLQIRCQEWCLKYLPQSVFGTSFSSMATTPVLSHLGFVSMKRTRGRETTGIRFKNPEVPHDIKERASAMGKPKKTTAQKTETNTIVTENATGGRVVTHQVMQSVSSVDPETDTLTHVAYEASVTHHEVHLGNL